MEIFFNTRKIEKLCNNNTEAVKKWGAVSAKKLQQRLSQLQNIERLGDIVHGKPHPLKGKRYSQFSISIGDAKRLVFEGIEPIPKTNDGTIYWKEVTKINIIFIGDYHE